jgi:aminoglycoside/choline kinase family phosphotransferase
MTRSELIEQFVRTHLSGEVVLHPLQADASFRRYIRVSQSSAGYIVMDAPPDKEDVRPYMQIGKFLKDAGYSAPAILAADAANGILLLEDLSDDTFSRLLKKDMAAEDIYYTGAMELLADWHMGGLNLEMLDIPLYDHAVYMREVKLLSDWFLPQWLEGPQLLDAQASYLACWESLLAAAHLQRNCFVHRDYHADNLMWLPARSGHAKIGLLDFQDALKGDAVYDIVSLLEDARRDVDAELAMKMRALYIAKTGVDVMQFEAAYALLAAQRNAKIIGIFTRLAARDGKLHYLDFLPRVWRYFESDIQHPTLAPLAAWVERYVPQDKRILKVIAKDANMLRLSA